MSKTKLQQAIKLAEAGENAKARECLMEILKGNPSNDTAWLWLATVVETRQQRQECLEEALRYNPRNKPAQRALKKMGVAIPEPPANSQEQKMSIAAHVMCGWPLILVIAGGAIGGALGGLAYGINAAIYKADMPVVLKIVLNVLVGVAAIVLWLVIAIAINR